VVETPTVSGRRIGVVGRAAARGDVRREHGPGSVGEIELKIDLIGLAADGQPLQRDSAIGLGHRGNERHVRGYKSRSVNSARGIMVIRELNLTQLRRRESGGIGAKAQLGLAEDIIGYYQGNGPRIGIAKHWTGGGEPVVWAAVASKYQGALAILKVNCARDQEVGSVQHQLVESLVVTTGVEYGRCVGYVIPGSADITAIQQYQGTGAGNALVAGNTQNAALDRDVTDEGVGGAQIEVTRGLFIGESRPDIP